MSTPLANPRRTRLASWPTRDSQQQDADQHDEATAQAPHDEDHSTS